MLGMIVRLSGCSARYSKPSEPEYVSDPLTESNTQTLCAGPKIGPFEVIELSLGGPLAEPRQQYARKQAKK